MENQLDQSFILPLKLQVNESSTQTQTHDFVAFVNQTWYLFIFLDAELESTTKVRIELVDDTKKVLSYTFIDGQNLNSKVIFSVRSNNGGGVITITTEFDKANSQIPTPEFYRDNSIKAFQEVDAYLLKA